MLVASENLTTSVLFAPPHRPGVGVMTDELKATILSLLIPCDATQQDKLLAWVENALADVAGTDEERSIWIRTQMHQGS